MAVINERAVLYTGCPRQADHGIATFSVASSKPSLPIVLVATIMYYVTTIKYLRLTHGDCRYYDFWQCMCLPLHIELLHEHRQLVDLNLFIVVSAVGDVSLSVSRVET